MCEPFLRCAEGVHMLPAGVFSTMWKCFPATCGYMYDYLSVWAHCGMYMHFSVTIANTSAADIPDSLNHPLLLVTMALPSAEDVDSVDDSQD